MVYVDKFVSLSERLFRYFAPSSVASLVPSGYSLSIILRAR